MFLDTGLKKFKDLAMAYYEANYCHKETADFNEKSLFLDGTIPLFKKGEILEILEANQITYHKKRTPETDIIVVGYKAKENLQAKNGAINDFSIFKNIENIEISNPIEDNMPKNWKEQAEKLWGKV